MQKHNPPKLQPSRRKKKKKKYKLKLRSRNPYLSSLVHFIRHGFHIDSQTENRQRQKWEITILRIRRNLQEILDRNGFPRVSKLVMFSPDIEIADILLKGLLPQIRNLQINSPFLKHLRFYAEESSGFCNLGELELGFSQDIFGSLNEHMYGAVRIVRSHMDQHMHSRLNNFFSRCPSLQILRINGTKELHTLLQSVTFPSLRALEIGPVLNHQIDFAIICLNSFLERHPDVSRLALKNLPNETSHSLKLSEASCLNMREFISSIEEIPSDYSMFLRQFQGLETYRLEHHVIVGEVLYSELLELLSDLQFNSPGIKKLTLPMPSHISGWALTEHKMEMARNALMGFGKALAEFIPTVEEFGVCQTGRFSDLGAVRHILCLCVFSPTNA